MEFFKFSSINKSYSGNGINHENQKFDAKLELSKVAGGKGATLKFKATGEAGDVFHEESTLIGQDYEI